MIHAFIKKGCFQDSVSLMLISRSLSNHERIKDVSIMMGTPANKVLLDTTGFWHSDFDSASANDICIAIRGKQDQESMDTEEVNQLLDDAFKKLSESSTSGSQLSVAYRWQTALDKNCDTNLVLISIAGEYAPELASKALQSGHNVMIFSDNVSIEDEIRLKRYAKERDLIVMGPDCGTSVIAGTPLAFANVMPKGPIGIIGASGTGIQELCSQIALHKQGITHAIGLGGRDLSEQVQGLSALSAIEMLANDSQTQVISFVSKPPAKSVREKVIAALQAVPKPVVALFLGYRSTQRRQGNIWFADTLSEAARLCAFLARIEQKLAPLAPVHQRKIFGLFSGGTLASETALLLASELGLEASHSHDCGIMLEGDGHKVLDLGDDHYTVGRPHPMIDPTLRNAMIEDLATQPEIGVLLIDIVLGYGAVQDPAADLIRAFNKARQARSDANPLIAIAIVTGSEQDPQCRSTQISLLQQAGILVAEDLEELTQIASQAIGEPKPTGQSAPHNLLESVSVINAGLRRFADDLLLSDTPVIHYQWAPVAGGNKRLAYLLEQLK